MRYVGPESSLGKGVMGPRSMIALNEEGCDRFLTGQVWVEKGDGRSLSPPSKLETRNIVAF